VEVFLRKGLAEGVNSDVKLINSAERISVKLGESLDFIVRFLLFLVSDALLDECFRSNLISLSFKIDLGKVWRSSLLSLLIILLILLFPLILVIDVGDHSLLLLLGVV